MLWQLEALGQRHALGERLVVRERLQHLLDGHALGQLDAAEEPTAAIAAEATSASSTAAADAATEAARGQALGLAAERRQVGRDLGDLVACEDQRLDGVGHDALRR